MVFRYLDNPNGSLRDIAGMRNAGGNVVGLMPHPERADEFDPRLRRRHAAVPLDGRVGRPIIGRRVMVFR